MPTPLRAFKQWRRRLGLTQTKAAAALGLSVQHIKRLEAGGTPISRPIALACKWVEHVRDKRGAP